jgi:hypothetical protein
MRRRTQYNKEANREAKPTRKHLSNLGMRSLGTLELLQHLDLGGCCEITDVGLQSVAALQHLSRASSALCRRKTTKIGIGFFLLMFLSVLSIFSTLAPQLPQKPFRVIPLSVVL